MSDIGSYVSRARESRSGEIRFAEGMNGPEERLINSKGNLGSRIASFFKGIGIKVGLFTDTRSLRTQAAYEGFKAAMQERYDPKIVDKALEKAEQKEKRPEGSALTGGVVLRAMKAAHRLQRDEAFEVAFKKLGTNQDALSPDELKAARNRYDAQVRPGSTPDELALFAEKAISDVGQLSEVNRLQASEDAVTTFNASVKDALRTMGSGGTAQQVLDKSAIVSTAHENLKKTEAFETDLKEDVDRMSDAVFKAMEELKYEDPSTHAALLKSLTGPQSMNRALADAALKHANHETSTPLGDKISNEGGKLYNTLTALSEGVYRTVDPNKETALRSSLPNVDGNTSQQAQQAMQVLIKERTALDSTPGRRLIDELAFQAPSENRLWQGDDKNRIATFDLRAIMHVQYRNKTADEVRMTERTDEERKQVDNTIADRKQAIRQQMQLSTKLSEHIDRQVKLYDTTRQAVIDDLRNSLLGDDARGDIHPLVVMAIADELEALRNR
jgi:hypothetical protein